MSIKLTILQNFNKAVNNAPMNDGARLQEGKFQLGGAYEIQQIPSNKYDHAANNAVRRNFASALTGVFGVKSLEDLPANVRKSLKIEDFKLDKNGNITSTRPLTARRVRAVMSAIQEVTAKAAPSRQEAEAIRNNFNTFLQNSAYMKAAFDRIAIAEDRKPLTLNIPLISSESFEVPLSALKVYTKGIKPAELASKIEDIKLAIAADAALAKETLGRLMRGETVESDATRANALRHYFALCAAASDETGCGISRTVSVPDANGKLAEFLKSSLKDADNFETGVVHTPADPFLSGSQAMTRFSVDIGFKESARYGGEAWMGAFRAYECLITKDGFSPLMQRGFEMPMAISQMYSNITAESIRLINAYDAEMEAMFKANPSLKDDPEFDLTKLPQPFAAKINKILSLRQTLQDFLSQLTLAKPIYGDHPAIRFANETVLTADRIPAMNLGGMNADAVDQAVAVGAPADPYEGLTIDAVLQELAAKAPQERRTDEARLAWAAAYLADQLPEERQNASKALADFITDYGKKGIPGEVMDFLKALPPRDLFLLRHCARIGASNLQQYLANAGAKNVNLYKMFACGEMPLTLSGDFFKAMSDAAVVMLTNDPGEDFDLLEGNQADQFVNFTKVQWGFGTVDISAILKLVKASGYDLATVTLDDLHKLMALARLSDYRLGDIPAFYGRVLHKTVPEITADDLKTLFRMYKSNKLMDPLSAVKPGRTADVISLFRGDRLPSSTAVSGKDMVRIVTTLRDLAKDGGAKEVTVSFNDKAVKLRQLEGGQLYVTVNGVMVAGAQTAASFAKIFESDMASHVDRYGAENLLRMLPELTVADLADLPLSTSHTRELCLRILEDRFSLPASSFATVPTAALRTIAANALKGYYTTETGAVNKSVVSSLLTANTRNDVFTGEEVRDLHAAMMRTTVEELNRKVVFPKPPAAPKALFLTKEQRLAEMQVKVRNLFADFIMNADIISYDEAQRKGEGAQRILNLLKQNLDTFVEVIMDPKSALAGLAEPMRSALEERLTELSDALPHDPNANAFVKSAMKAMYKNALTVMLDVATLPEAERAAAVAEKVNANTALKGAIALKQTTLDELSSMILDMIPQIAQLDAAMDELVATAMQEIQNTVDEKFAVPEDAAPEEAEEAAAPREEIWQQSFERLMGGALTDTKSGYGKFMHEVLSHYFADASPQEGRQMLASLFRNTDANSTPGQVVGALFKGAGPLLQKILQALPADAFGEEMADALKDMKSNLQPIPEAIVKAHMLDIVNRSNGEIKSIEVIRSLGAASVGQAFLCRMITAEHPSGEECVVKLLRPNVKTIIENERQRFVAAAKNTPGMEKTFEGQYARILEELDFTKEKTNINFARNVYEQPVMIYHEGIVRTTEHRVTMNNLHSMEVHPSVPPTMDSLILKKAPGETYDRYMANTREKAREIIGEVNAEGKASYKDTGTLRATKAKLTFLYNNTKRRQDLLLQLAEKWVQEALYGNGFYHGDLHAGNIMTDGEGLTVIDFGNATHLTETERTHVIRMMAAAMYGRENYFEESLKALISGEGRAKYDSQNADGELTKVLHEILNKGTTHNTGQRIIAALTALQQYGIELPGPIYNFAQCQMRLGAAVEEMTKLMNELDAAMNNLELAPLENAGGILGAAQNALSPKLYEGWVAIKALFEANPNDNHFKDCAEAIEGIFGAGRLGASPKFDKEKLPDLLSDLQAAFNNREVFDACVRPIVERFTEAKLWHISPQSGVETVSRTGDELRGKLNTFLASRDGNDATGQEEAAQGLAKAFVDAVRTFTGAALATFGPVRAEAPEDGEFVGAVANVVNANLQSAMRNLGKMMLSTALDMRSANAAEAAANERMEKGRRKVGIYLTTFANSSVSLETAQMLARIAQGFQHPLKMPGLNGKANSLKTGEKRATFLSTLQFNLKKLENELREEGRLNETTPEEMKKHFVCIAMEFFADRIGGIADAVQKMPERTYQALYQEASQNDDGVFKVCDALAYFRNPIEVPPAESPAAQPPAAQ